MEEKLKKAKQGDIAIFNELFQQHNSSLKSYLYRLLTNREDVEDFYHNTFIKAFEKIDTFNGDVTQLKSWIFTIATPVVHKPFKPKEKVENKCTGRMQGQFGEQPRRTKELCSEGRQKHT